MLTKIVYCLSCMSQNCVHIKTLQSKSNLCRFFIDVSKSVSVMWGNLLYPYISVICKMAKKKKVPTSKSISRIKIQ
jgi:hypothetical protein